MRAFNLLFETPDSFEKEYRRFQDTINGLHGHPFGREDSSVGMEYELQTAVEGEQGDVDLPIIISNSIYYKNIVRRTFTGDLCQTTLDSLKSFLYQNPAKVWENSWVRFREHHLTHWTRQLLARDFLADKSKPKGKRRADAHRFYCQHKGVGCMRLPMSYVLKLALANAISTRVLPEPLLETGVSLLENFISDNISPEVLSFTIPTAARGTIGSLAAKESARTLLFCQLLAQYANKSLGLEESGQKCRIYNAPHAPSRQKQLNGIVPDGFYRQLFISPCLSGWDRGEKKHRYMELCHRTLSRSQLNTIKKLKDAGIIVNNLIVLPNTSNTCLANNGIHVSLGSRLLSNFARVESAAFSPVVEKYFGDLVIKIVEHFLPLFVGTYSGAPYRLSFNDFHPEKVLGFLPHELDYTHLRMLWRRWKRKADIQFLGRTITPFGPCWIDKPLSKILRLQGDYVPDFRLIDYLVTLLSTETSPALNGILGNQEKLKEELTEMGIFDSSMSIYLPYRQRAFGIAGYVGFEGRSYSLFPGFFQDMAPAVDMQNLVTALACRYVLQNRIVHDDIPDNPSVESERRQIFFCCAIGIPTVYIRKDTGNRFLKKILSSIPGQRNSMRYQGYIRVRIEDYRRALLDIMEADGADLIESLGMKTRIEELRGRLDNPREASFGQLSGEVSRIYAGGRSPLQVSADEFNLYMENYYRTTLRKKHLEEAFALFTSDCERLERLGDPLFKQVLEENSIADGGSLFLKRCLNDILEERATPAVLETIMHMGLAVIRHERESSAVS